MLLKMDECLFFGCMDECLFCGCYDPNLGCTCPSVDEFYACFLELELIEEDFKTTRENQKIEKFGNKL